MTTPASSYLARLAARVRAFMLAIVRRKGAVHHEPALWSASPHTPDKPQSAIVRER